MPPFSFQSQSKGHPCLRQLGAKAEALLNSLSPERGGQRQATSYRLQKFLHVSTFHALIVTI